MYSFDFILLITRIETSVFGMGVLTLIRDVGKGGSIPCQCCQACGPKSTTVISRLLFTTVLSLPSFYLKINVREYRRSNKKKWTIQRHWQHRVHKTKTNKAKTQHNMCWTPLCASKHTNSIK